MTNSHLSTNLNSVSFSSLVFLSESDINWIISNDSIDARKQLAEQLRKCKCCNRHKLYHGLIHIRCPKTISTLNDCQCSCRRKFRWYMRYRFAEIPGVSIEYLNTITEIKKSQSMYSDVTILF